MISLRGLNTVQDTLVLDPRDAGMQHGTWCLGVMAGRKFGTYVGAAFDAQYALGRTEVDAFERTQEMIYWGMGAEWADSLGADIISSSLGYSRRSTSTAYNYSYSAMDGHTTVISRAAQIAAQKGIIVVSAAGNEGNQAMALHHRPSGRERRQPDRGRRGGPERHARLVLLVRAER